MPEEECPFCHSRLRIEGGTIAPVLQDSERCGSISPLSKFRCTERVGHEGEHKNYPWVWS